MQLFWGNHDVYIRFKSQWGLGPCVLKILGVKECDFKAVNVEGVCMWQGCSWSLNMPVIADGLRNAILRKSAWSKMVHQLTNNRPDMVCQAEDPGLATPEERCIYECVLQRPSI